MLTIMRIKGTVSTGKHGGTKYTTLDWVKKQIEQKLGFKPYPGTLNLKLEPAETQKLRQFTQKAQPIIIQPEKSFYPGKCYKVTVDNIKCSICFPEVPDYPADLLEIIAPQNLREKLKLKDGDIVEVNVQA